MTDIRMARCARLFMAAALALPLAAPARAETLVDAYGLGTHAPKPEEWLKIDDELSIRARIVRRAGGEPVAQADQGDTLRLDLAFYVQPGAQDRDIRLTCSVLFYDAHGDDSEYVIEDKPCYAGRLADGAERFQPLDLDLRFRPRASDPAGTSAVVVRVKDMVINDAITLTPTYDWQGGR